MNVTTNAPLRAAHACANSANSGSRGRIYISPSLLDYGRIADLTAGGSGTSSEFNRPGKCTGRPGVRC